VEDLCMKMDEKELSKLVSSSYKRSIAIPVIHPSFRS
jgi:hypothetical protein